METGTRKKRTDAEFSDAYARGQEMLASEPRASAARYDEATEQVTVDLVNGCTYKFPPHLVQGLSDATSEELARIEVQGRGFNLHWPKLDLDLYVPALVSGVFGTQDWLVKALARHAGRSTSPAKAAAARANGAKGGRPRKSAARSESKTEIAQ